MVKQRKMIGQITTLSLIFFAMFMVYKIGYYIGRDDCLVVIENTVTAIRDLSESLENYHREIALLEVHRRIQGK